jgi:hypothetical protein
MRSKFLLILAGVLAVALALFGTARAAWTFPKSVDVDETAMVGIPQWNFVPDFAKIDNVGSCSYLTAARETSIVSPSGGDYDAVRLTNTAGTQTKSHSFVLDFDRDYTLGEIRFHKVEFDYYHAEKRQQAGKGFPKLQLLYNNSNKGSQQGGGETINEKSPFIATSIDENWWHLEYFITALAPTMADYQDTPISTSTKINGMKIIDDYVYDYGTSTEFMVIDNARLSIEPSPRLGLFNRTASYASGTYYWLKVAWTGELRSAVITVDDPTIAEQAPSTKSPFYIKGLRAGTFTATATLTIGDGQVLSITSNRITVT